MSDDANTKSQSLRSTLIKPVQLRNKPIRSRRLWYGMDGVYYVVEMTGQILNINKILNYSNKY